MGTTQSSLTVISQNPAPGSFVAPGAAVNLILLPESSSEAPKPGKPKISGKITAKGQDPSGALFVNLELTDTGKGDAVNVQISRLTLHTLRGKGKVTYDTALSGPLPLEIGRIDEGASTTVRLLFNVPPEVTRFSIEETGTMQNTAGKRFDFTISQPVN
ncbi:MAG: PASTA domain-containing protein [Syntrophobacteraceae bacterium]